MSAGNMIIKYVKRGSWVISTALLLLLVVAEPGRASTASPVVKKLLEEYARAAQKADPAFTTFDAAKGRELYQTQRRNSKNNETISCSTCHTSDPRQSGKSAAGKIIDPLSPQANPKRLTDEREIRKWFFRNCNQVLERDCTPDEKGNFIQFLLNT